MERLHLNIGEWAALSGAKMTSLLFAGLHRASAMMYTTRSALVDLGQQVKRGHLRLHEALREKEHNLTRILADSPEPMVVTDDSHRFLAANPAALGLFGVSKGNIGKFTIDAFLTPSQAHLFERTGPPFIKGSARFGECKIRRLDGQLKSVGFIFQANFILGRHLSRFQVQDPPMARALES
jgi:PAS domain-containing protein